MLKIEIEELKKIQMDILQAVDRFCYENDIRYSIACGTLLGAVRHGGYIPWDDDIDIYMLRADFEKFERMFPECLDNCYKFGSLGRDKYWCLPFGKVYDVRTFVKEKRTRSNTPGVNIDVFPIDEVPKNYEEWKKFNEIRKSYIRDLRHSQMSFSKMNSIVKNIGVFVYSIKFLFSSPRKLAEKCDRFAQKYNGKGYDDVFETSMGLSVKKAFPKALFDEIEEIKFEDRKFKAFKKYDTYLCATFGDYMKLPPKEKRVSEHTMDAYWR